LAENCDINDLLKGQIPTVTSCRDLNP